MSVFNQDSIVLNDLRVLVCNIFKEVNGNDRYTAKHIKKYSLHQFFS